MVTGSASSYGEQMLLVPVVYMLAAQMMTLLKHTHGHSKHVMAHQCSSTVTVVVTLVAVAVTTSASS